MPALGKRELSTLLRIVLTLGPQPGYIPVVIFLLGVDIPEKRVLFLFGL